MKIKIWGPPKWDILYSLLYYNQIENFLFIWLDLSISIFIWFEKCFHKGNNSAKVTF